MSISNELMFAAHIGAVLGFLFWAVRLGREALTAFIALTAVLANLFVVKQMTLFGWTATCGDVFAVGAILGLNLLQEHFGKQAAERAAKISFFALLFFLAMSAFHLQYTSLQDTPTHSAFQEILAHTPRLAFASIAVYYIVQKIDILFFGQMKRIWGGRYLGARTAASLVLSQALDTALFTYLGLYGIASSLIEIMAVSFCIKCVVIACSAPIASLSKRWVRDVSL